jgi:hypothetical protein
LSPRQKTFQRLEQIHSIITSTWLQLSKARPIPLSHLHLEPHDLDGFYDDGIMLQREQEMGEKKTSLLATNGKDGTKSDKCRHVFCVTASNHHECEKYSWKSLRSMNVINIPSITKFLLHRYPLRPFLSEMTAVCDLKQMAHCITICSSMCDGSNKNNG